MDRKTLIFVVGLTIIFFLMHQFYDSFRKGKVTPSHLTEPKTEVIIQQQGEATLLNDKEMENFGISKIYNDFNLQNFVSLGFYNEDDQFLIIAPDTDLPEEVYATLQKDPKHVLRARLHIHPVHTDFPALYSLYPGSKLNIGWVPEEGAHDVFLVYFEGNKAYKISGVIEGDKLLKIDQKPPNNSIVFLSYEEKNTPFGFYNTHDNTLRFLDHLPDFEDYSLIVFPEERLLEKDFLNQRYYVLENEYAQFVLTDLNGCVSEINLPFQSEENSKSVVREISFDRIMEENYAMNDSFPQYSYFTNGDQKSKKTPKLGGYYPLLRRNIIGASFKTSTRINPHFYAFSIIDKDDLSSALKIYNVTRFEKNLIEFELKEGNRRIVKTFSLPNNADKAPYCLDLSVKIEGDSRNLLMTVGVPEVELISGSFTPTLKYQVIEGQKTKVEQIKPPKGHVSFSQVNANWYCNGNGFFGIILDPLPRSAPGLSVEPVSGELVPSRITMIDSQFHLYPPHKFPGYSMLTPVKYKAAKTDYRIFAGPFDRNILETVQQNFVDPTTGLHPNYVSAQSYHGWFAFISEPFAKFLFMIMNFFHSITMSWGISIILLTIVLRLMLYPLNNWSMKSTAKMQKVAPKIKEIQDKYKKDPKRAQLEIMNLYKKEGANPFGGCLPLLIQLPFLFGMFDLLKSSFDLRGAPFIPGWIDNLTAPDVLFSWMYPIPFIGNSFHLLPILLGMIMYFQQKITTLGGTKNAETDQQKQQRTIGNVMTIVFTFLFYNFPSGLNIYWISSMALGILQQWWVNKSTKLPAKGK